MKFSISTQGFYSDQFDYGDAMPADAVDITHEQYAAFFAGINLGCAVYNDDGTLMLSAARPDSYHLWDENAKAWTLTEEAMAQKSADEKARLMMIASAEITRTTTQIAILNDKIELDDYDAGETPASITTLLTTWKKYRIACHSVVNGRSSELPCAPDITWPDEPE
ncbi:tail fiber assembly protein [Lonsdalea quercina]|uniref:tail fiber assembly protein n=1 Tax=Lonsdalea quercina TaxID=71657 RepID=UPI003F46FC4B